MRAEVHCHGQCGVSERDREAVHRTSEAGPFGQTARDASSGQLAIVTLLVLLSCFKIDDDINRLAGSLTVACVQQYSRFAPSRAASPHLL